MTARGDAAGARRDGATARRARSEHWFVTRQCVECGRVFQLTDDNDAFDDNDAAEWTYGHDCEDNG